MIAATIVSTVCTSVSSHFFIHGMATRVLVVGMGSRIEGFKIAQ
jgi:hypothetical protein